MRVFVWEALCAGASPVRPVPGSLLREGRAMLAALAEDLLRIDGCEVQTLVSRNVAADLFAAHPRPLVQECSTVDEPSAFDRLSAEADWTWVIAPEIDGLLEERLQRAERAGGNIVGPMIPAATLCADKLRLARALAEWNVPAIPTESFEEGGNNARTQFPCVVKPRNGAGSLDCRLIQSVDECHEALSRAERELIVQPFVPGEALSCAAIVHEPDRVDLFPIGRQHLSADGTFQYLGGRIPVDVPCRELVEQTVRAVCRGIDGLRGYVGFDFLSPAAAPREALLVEINPRLTTSYIGYRRLTTANLAEHILSATVPAPIVWSEGAVEFFPDGRVVYDARFDQLHHSDSTTPRRG